VSSIRSRVSFRRRVWSPAEDNLIREQYPDVGAEGIATQIGCYPSLVANRARWLKVSMSREAIKRLRSTAGRKITEHRRASGAPKFLSKHEPYSRSWYLAQQHAFSEAMKLNPTERPS
jgi:hypothetical protein